MPNVFVIYRINASAAQERGGKKEGGKEGEGKKGGKKGRRN
jgi:hypothetical protein